MKLLPNIVKLPIPSTVLSKHIYVTHTPSSMLIDTPDI